MKGLKKLLTGILAATMVMGASLTAFAVDDATASIEITRHDTYDADAQEGQVQAYTWYRLMDATIIDATDDSDAKAAYYVDTLEKAEALKKSGFFKYTEVTTNHYNIELADNVPNNETTAKAMAAYFAGDGKADLAKFPSSGEAIPADKDGVTTIDTLKKGYYYITSTLGTSAIVKTLGNEKLVEKNQYPSVDKKQKDDDIADYINEEVGVGVGDKVYYEIKVNVPANTSDDIIVTDTMSMGLDFADPWELKVTGYGAGSEANAQKGTDGRSFTINLPPNSGAADISTITFTAVVNKDAIIDNDKENEVTIDYGNYHNVDTVYYKIYRAGAFKYDGSTGKELEGVKFTLKKNNADLKVSLHDDGYYYVDATGSSTVTTNKKGFILIRGLDNMNDTYTLTETETLPGYNLLDAPKTLENLAEDSYGEYAPTVDKDDQGKLPLENQTTFKELITIANNTGSLLPSTGGIGTTIFYIVGAILIVAGVAYFIVRRKANAQ